MTKLVRSIIQQLMEQFDKPGAIGATNQWCQKLIALYPQLADDGETSGEKTESLRSKIRHRIRYVNDQKKKSNIDNCELSLENVATSSPTSKPAPSEEPNGLEDSDSSDDNLASELINLTKEQTGGMVVSEAVMKAKLRTKFDEFEWASTFQLRQTEISKPWPTVSLKAHWPFLFRLEGVFFIKIFTKIIKLTFKTICEI